MTFAVSVGHNLVHRAKTQGAQAFARSWKPWTGSVSMMLKATLCIIIRREGRMIKLAMWWWKWVEYIIDLYLPDLLGLLWNQKSFPFHGIQLEKRDAVWYLYYIILNVMEESSRVRKRERKMEKGYTHTLTVVWPLNVCVQCCLPYLVVSCCKPLTPLWL